ncbi:MAG TPA: glycosyltransferase [Gemmatimonadales bacterium]
MNSAAGSAGQGVETPVRVYVGSQEAQMLPVKVLEYSIRKHTELPVEIFPLHHASIEVPMPRDPRNRPRTPFSFQRFYIPQLAGFRGRAIYLDSDMQVFRDIRELWSLPFDGADLLSAWERGESGRRPQFSVMLLNCEALRWDLPEIVQALDRGELTYETLMYEMRVAKSIHTSIDPSWNSLEHYEAGVTGLLHYTDMTRQPWVSRDNRLGYLWVRDLAEAIAQGVIERGMVEAHVREGYVRPSLLHQLEHGVEDPSKLPAAGTSLDARFVPPYKLMAGHAAAGAGLLQRTRGLLRRVYERSPFFRGRVQEAKR